jgi:hypothetical protein
MQLGKHLRELWRFKIGLGLSIAIAMFAAVWSVGTVSVFPPRFTPRALEMASATTRVLVDTPSSSVADLSVQTGDFASITSRALLVSNVMTSQPVREYIARRAHVRPESLEIASPVTREWPRQLAQSGSSKSSSDLLDSPDQYRLSLRSNPTVPVIDVYARAPTAKSAEDLANGAVTGLRDYLTDLGAHEGVAPQRQVQLRQLGTADSAVINDGVSINVAVLVFVLAFGASAAAVLFVARMRRGWQLEALTEPELAPPGRRVS